MNYSTYIKIQLASTRIRRIHKNLSDYEFILPLLDEPYSLALRVLDYEDRLVTGSLTYQEVGAELDVNWQTIKQVLRALE